jgi:hypothetical protein
MNITVRWSLEGGVEVHFFDENSNAQKVRNGNFSLVKKLSTEL